jgi:hemerythrin superfamily protein
MPDIDAITLLKNDHKAVEKLFKRFEKAGGGAAKTKRKIVDDIIRELSIHAEIEEQLFYPAVRAAGVPDAKDMVLESLEEHGVAKWLLSELDGMDPEAERFDAKVTVLIETIRHHIEEEEGEMFPAVRKVLKRKALTELGGSMDQAKGIVPTHPHPRSPDTPPGNIAAGLASAAIDRARDAGREALERAKKTVP